MSSWSVRDIPPQRGRLAIVTGATGGLGYETALALAGAGAEVILAGRNSQKGADAVRRIRAEHRNATVAFERLDLASLASVSAFAEAVARRHDHLDILINNAGVMALPKREVTADGFEMQFQTNYLGHFLLTARLLPLLRRADGARVVSLASIAALNGRIALDDLQSQRNYRAWTTYSQSKLACLMFALELDRRSKAAGWGIASIGAHPGVAGTDLIANGPGSGNAVNALLARVMRMTLPLFGQSSAQGALPSLYAATAPEAQSGAYYGPDGIREFRGAPAPAHIPSQALDQTVAARLWDTSEELTDGAFSAFTKAA